jgi:hypothetical protein
MMIGIGYSLPPKYRPLNSAHLRTVLIPSSPHACSANLSMSSKVNLAILISLSVASRYALPVSPIAATQGLHLPVAEVALRPISGVYARVCARTLEKEASATSATCMWNSVT